jgi:membrane-associated phospholipid phosphatase
VKRVVAARAELAFSAGMLSALTFAALSILAAYQGVFDLDHSTRELVGTTRLASLQGSMEAVSLLGQGTALIPLILLASLLAWRPRRRWALAFPLVMAGTGALQFLAKWAVDRPRPNEAAWGFPSGHALSVLVFFGLVAYLVCTSGTRRCWRWTSVALAVATILTVGFSRLYLNMHWLSDVGGGFAVGLAYLLIAIWLVEQLPARRFRRVAPCAASSSTTAPAPVTLPT